MSTLQGAIVGFGRMGMTHYAILNTHPDVKIAAVCDSSDIMLKNLKRFTGVQVFTDLHKMLDQVKLDFVVVATPTSSHAEIGMQAAEKGIHVFMEKPFTLTCDEGKQLVEAARKRGITNQVGYFLRFCPIFGAARKAVADGVIGEVKNYRNDMFGRTVLKASKSSWRAAKKTGGGCMLDFGSHSLDLADQIFGPVEQVSGSQFQSVYSSEVEDVFLSTLRHQGGVVGVVHINWSDDSYRRPYNRLEVFGTRGRIVADRQEIRVYLREAAPQWGYVQGWNIKYLPELEKSVRFSVRGSDYTEQLDDFISCIQSGRQTRCTFADALRTDKVIEGIRTNAAADKEKTWIV